MEPWQLEPRITLHDLFIPESSQVCEVIEGEDEAEAARNLAFKLREAKLI
jgi:hypothetical protein